MKVKQHTSAQGWTPLLSYKIALILPVANYLLASMSIRKGGR